MNQVEKIGKGTRNANSLLPSACELAAAVRVIGTPTKKAKAHLKKLGIVKY